MGTNRSRGSSRAPDPSTASLLCALTLLLAACTPTDHGPVTPGPPENPQPAFVQLPDGVTLSVDGRALTAGASRRVTFSGPAYGIRVTVTGHTQGTLVLDLRDEYGTLQRHDRISSDTTIVDSGRTFNRPGFVDAAFTDFTGRVDLTLRDVGSVTAPSSSSPAQRERRGYTRERPRPEGGIP